MKMTNKYDCPSKIWRKFSDAAKKIYNEVMSQSLKNQDITCHPKGDEIGKDEWHTICHNFSCYAAWAFDGESLRKNDEVIDIRTSTGKKVKRRRVA